VSDLLVSVAIASALAIDVAWWLSRGAWYRRNKRRELGYSGALTHRLTFPAGPHGEPAVSLLAPSRSTCDGAMVDDVPSREYVKGFVGRHALFFLVCFGPAADLDGIPAFSNRAISTCLGLGGATLVEAPAADVVAGRPAMRYVLGLAGGQKKLIEWKFEVDGWMFGAGVLRHRDRDLGAEGLARSALSTLTTG
jgi:hypothetical protein